MSAATDVDPAVGAVPDGEPSPPHWRRHPADVARLVFTVLVVAVLAVLGALDPASVKTVSTDTVRLFSHVPDGLASLLVGLLQLLAVVGPVVLVGALVARRSFRLLVLLGAAAGLAAAVMALASSVAAETVPVSSLGTTKVDSWFIGRTFPSATYLASSVAVVTAGSPWMRRPWRRTAWVFVVLLTVTRLVTATEVPQRSLLLLAIGAAAGSAALVLVGAPPRRIDVPSVRAALTRAGITEVTLTPVPGDEDAPSFRATGTDVDAYLHVIGRDERDTDLLLKVLRGLTRRGLGDDRPVLSPRRSAEHEALALALAHTAGIAAPRPLGVSVTEEGSGVVAQEWVAGTRLDELGADALDDALLAAVWEQVALLQRHRIAHRSLRLEHLLVSGAAPEPVTVTVTGFRFADVSADDRLLGIDVAELLVALAEVVGVDRSVRSAAAALDREALARSLPLVQPSVLSSRTRTALKKRKGLLKDLQQALQAAAGVETFELAKVQRLTLKGVVSLAGSLVLGYYLLSIVANWSDIWDAITTADAAYLVPILLMTVVTTMSGALSLMGAVLPDLPFLRTTQIMYAQSFLNRFTPANAGGMALRARFLQMQGVDMTVAAAAIGLTSVASGVMQGIFLVFFLVAGGASDELGKISLPSTSAVLLAVVAVAVVGGVLFLSRWGRRVVVPLVRKHAGRAFHDFRRLAGRPDRLGELFGGAGLGKLATIAAFWLTILAFGQDMSFVRAGALYMVANTIGSAVPTPGGVGGIEAALTAALLSAGLDNATAAAIVVVFRFFTFWLPTLPGWGFLQYVQRKGYV
ncbi:MAG: flippase-like domain-containing protein [Acidimicrobiales bacterium]|nr:flippase-like domain-containing protein [Acidimicrobiales bacterium]